MTEVEAKQALKKAVDRRFDYGLLIFAAIFFLIICSIGHFLIYCILAILLGVVAVYGYTKTEKKIGDISKAFPQIIT